MKTVGESLYDSYRKAQLDINSCETDPWDSLPDDDKAAWEKAGNDFLGIEEVKGQ